MPFDAPTVGQTQVVITVQRLSPLAIFFLAGTEFRLRDPLLIKRAFNVPFSEVRLAEERSPFQEKFRPNFTAALLYWPDGLRANTLPDHITARLYSVWRSSPS